MHGRDFDNPKYAVVAGAGPASPVAVAGGDVEGPDGPRDDIAKPAINAGEQLFRLRDGAPVTALEPDAN